MTRMSLKDSSMGDCGARTSEESPVGERWGWEDK